MLFSRTGTSGRQSTCFPHANEFEVFTQADGVSGHSLLRSPELAVQPLVPSTSSNDPVLHPPTDSQTIPTSEEQQMVRFPLSEPSPTRMDFFRKCFTKSYSTEVTELLVQKLRGSSRNQYESTWKLFLNSVHMKRPT